MVEIDILIEDDRWPADMAGLVEQAIRASIDFLQLKPQGPSELSILLTNDKQQQQLNTQWREKSSSTNVLSFPQIEPFAPLFGLLGDISLAYETVAKEALNEKKTLSDHVTHLCIHGFLHILGYDHLTDEEAEEMEDKERKILSALEIADPYAELSSNG